MIPLRDEIRARRRPFATYFLLGLNIAVFLYELSLGGNLNQLFSVFGAVPYKLFHPTSPVVYLTLISSMFLHGGIAHILGNMLFLWVFADNIEDRIGHVKFIFFYLICGIAGALLHAVTAVSSRVPMVGASGAISGVLGAYILFFPRARILALVPMGFFMRTAYLPAFFFLGFWILYQVLLGLFSLGAGTGVAYFAHIGGFAAGLLLVLPFKFGRRSDPAEYSIF